MVTTGSQCLHKAAFRRRLAMRCRIGFHKTRHRVVSIGKRANRHAASCYERRHRATTYFSFRLPSKCLTENSSATSCRPENTRSPLVRSYFARDRRPAKPCGYPAAARCIPISSQTLSVRVHYRDGASNLLPGTYAKLRPHLIWHCFGQKEPTIPGLKRQPYKLCRSRACR